MIALEFRFKLDFDDDFTRVREEKEEVIKLYDDRLGEIQKVREKRSKEEADVIH